MKKLERQVALEVLDMLFKDYEGPKDWPQIEERLGFSGQAPVVSWLSKP
jgi:hypothetical protein